MPRYDRSTDEQLHFSNRKRPAGALLAADAAAASAAGRPIKRLRNSGRWARGEGAGRGWEKAKGFRPRRCCEGGEALLA